MRPWWLCVLVACAPEPAVVPPAAPPAPVPAPAPRPAPPAPAPDGVDDCEAVVRQGQLGVVVTNHFAELPAVTDDGALVAVAVFAGGELAVELLDATRDLRVGRVVVVDADRERPGLHDRVLRARLLFADKRLLPLDRYEIEGGAAEGNGATLRYREPILSVAGLGPAPLEQAVPHWSGKCPAALDEAYGRAELGTFLAVIGYTGSVGCGERSYHAFHVEP
jgi:hypothetical protein